MKVKQLMGGCAFVLFLTMVFSCASGQKAGAPSVEAYKHKAPSFTVMVPKDWYVSKESKNPNSVLRKAYGPYEIPSTEIAVADKSADTEYEDLVDGMEAFFEEKYGASDFKTLYQRKTKLKDGTPAFEFEMRWQHPEVLLYTYQLAVFKGDKIVSVSVTSNEKVNEQLKQIAYSLSFK